MMQIIRIRVQIMTVSLSITRWFLESFYVFAAGFSLMKVISSYFGSLTISGLLFFSLLIVS